MRICYLILTHSSPQLYQRLVETLTAAGDCVVTHVDLKADATVFTQACPESTNVAYLNPRIDIKWGSWSMMRAEMDMLRLARERFPEADYYWMISGDTYPLRSPHSIHEFLTANSGKEFLNYISMPARQYAKPITRISHRHFNYDLRTGSLRRPLILFSKFARRPFRHLLGGRQPFGGSQWFTLTPSAVDRLIQVASTDSRLWRLVRTSAHADEWFVQTVLVNDPAFKDVTRPALFWADFRPSTPVPRPPVLGAEQIIYLKSLPYVSADNPNGRALLVGRKFCDRTLDLVEMVEQELWSIPTNLHLVPEMV